MELKPCPFCKAESYSSYHQNDGDYWAVHCTECYARIISRHRDTGLDSPTKVHVEKEWNTRPIEAELAAENARLREALQLAYNFLHKSEMAAKLACRLPNPPQQAREFLEVQGRICDVLAQMKKQAGE